MYEQTKKSQFSPRLLNREQASNYVGVSARTFDKMVTEGTMPKPTRIYARTVWDLRKLDDAIDALVGVADDLGEWAL